MVVEAAFGRLKGRFRCLLKRVDTTLKYLPKKIAACVVLHNLCEMKDESFSEEWLNGIPDECCDSAVAAERAPVDVGKDAIRNALVNFFATL